MYYSYRSTLYHRYGGDDDDQGDDALHLPHLASFICLIIIIKIVIISIIVNEARNCA